jgi:hypothetical protein
MKEDYGWRLVIRRLAKCVMLAVFLWFLWISLVSMGLGQFYHSSDSPKP